MLDQGLADKCMDVKNYNDTYNIGRYQNRTNKHDIIRYMKENTALLLLGYHIAIC